MTTRQASVMMLMTVVGMVMQFCRAILLIVISETNEEGTCGPSPVNRAYGAVLHSLRSLRPLRR